MDTQRANGSWYNGGNLQAQTEVDTIMALLVLERSLGGACIDTDGDGAGDACDSCPEMENPEQGDCCMLNVEQCNGEDDDCDGNVDEDAIEVDERCDAGGVGVCAAGRYSCVDGELRCDEAGDPAPEGCSGFDDDCDGVVDEGTRNACGVCEAPPLDRCDGADGERCLDGACVPDGCYDVSCPEGQACADGVCAPDPCFGVECEENFICLAGDCVPDPCALVHCPTGQICVAIEGRGQCFFPEQVPGQGDPLPDGGMPDMGMGDLDMGTADAGDMQDAGGADAGDADAGTTGGGGDGADGGGGGAPSWLWLLLCIPWSRRRRR